MKYIFSTMLLVLAFPASADVNGDACKEAFFGSANDQFQCTLNYTSSSSEKAELVQKTGGIIKDLNCSLPLSLSKSDLTQALLNETKVAPGEQIISCDVHFNAGTRAVKLYLAPSFTIVGDRVEQANINLTKVTGLPAFVGKLIKKFVNDDDKIREGIQEELSEFLIDIAN